MSRHEIYSANFSDLVKGTVGTGATVAAAVTSQLAEIEILMRILLHGCGIAVALVTIWSIVKRNRGH